MSALCRRFLRLLERAGLRRRRGRPGPAGARRFDDATSARLEALRWWGWLEERVWEQSALISRGPIEELPARVGAGSNGVLPLPES